MISRTLFMSAAFMAVLSVPSYGISLETHENDDIDYAQTDLDALAVTEQPCTDSEKKAAKILGITCEQAR